MQIVVAKVYTDSALFILHPVYFGMPLCWAGCPGPPPLLGCHLLLPTTPAFLLPPETLQFQERCLFRGRSWPAGPMNTPGKEVHWGIYSRVYYTKSSLKPEFLARDFCKTFFFFFTVRTKEKFPRPYFCVSQRCFLTKEFSICGLSSKHFLYLNCVWSLFFSGESSVPSCQVFGQEVFMANWRQLHCWEHVTRLYAYPSQLGLNHQG